MTSPLTYAKAIAGLLTPIILLFLLKIGLPADSMSDMAEYVTFLITGIVTFLTVYWTKNKPA